jgi:mannose-6-phosphate isomerase
MVLCGLCETLMTDTPLYPLKFNPIYKPKVWGGRHLEKLGKTLPGDAQNLIGESWEITDLVQTSPSGGGGGTERSVVANGPLAGQSLHVLIERFGERLMGRVALSESGEFPLLVKFLDARQHLSVQVHPSADYCRTNPKASLKSEAWYVLDADPGAVIYKGIRAGVTPERFRAAVTSGSAEAVRELLIEVKVKAGDCHYLPSGTCHALGAGSVVAEVQTPSDTTFRVFDWGRTDRALHLDQAMQCIEFGPPDVRKHEKRSHIAGMFTTITRLIDCEHFRIEKVRMAESFEQEIPYDQPAVWMVLEGKGRITPAAGSAAPVVPFARGDTLLIPANMDDAKVVLEADTVWLEVTFPKAMKELE